MTTFPDYDEEIHQFLHLSIQEFLAAWWIVKDEGLKTDEVFKEHFDDDHFRMCLRFVAGLTHLKPEESYQQYFNKPLDLECKRKPLFRFDIGYLSCFHQNADIQPFNHPKDTTTSPLPIFLFQLLYETQNTALCHTLAQSINNQHLCVRKSLTLFDMLCIGYFINHSNSTWNHLDIWSTNEKQLTVFTEALNNTFLRNKCKRLELLQWNCTNESIYTMLQSSLLHNIQECYYCQMYTTPFPLCLILINFIKLPQLKVLHLNILSTSQTIYITTAYTEDFLHIEQCLEANYTLRETKFNLTGIEEGLKTKTITSIINGLTRNKTITSFELVTGIIKSPLPDGTIEHLLMGNNTLQALTLDIPDILIPSLNITHVNTPLTALNIQGIQLDKINLFLPFTQ